LTKFILTNLLPTDPLSSTVEDHDGLPPVTMWRLSFRPREGLSMRKLGKNEWIREEGRWGFLDEGYVQYVLRHRRLETE
jgi:hypothetical protein